MSGESPPANQPPTQFEIKGTVPRLIISRRYKLGLCAVAVLMLLLPLLYLALIAGVGWLVWHHLISNAALAQSQFAFEQVLYYVPLGCGAALLLIMLKPLVIWLPRDDDFIELGARDAPQLFEVVRQISTALHVSAPTRIRLDMRANAAASIQNRWVIFRQTTLFLGIPLIASVTVQELAGVIAHEICHMSQRTAMRLTAFIRIINQRLAYAVYGPNSISEMLDTQEIGPLYIVIGPARLCVWATRGVLWLLMYTGYTLSHFLLHQMELDADRCAARIAGSGVFSALESNLDLMSAAISGTVDDLNMAVELDKTPAVTLPLLEANRELRRALWFPLEHSDFLVYSSKYQQTHPPFKERLAASQAEAAEGLIESDVPATALFDDFSSLVEKFVVGQWFQKHLKKIPKLRTDAGELLRAFGKDAETLSAYKRFFGVPFCIIRPLPLQFKMEELTKPDDGPNSAEFCAALRATVAAQRAEFQALIPAWTVAIAAYSEEYARAVESMVSAAEKGGARLETLSELLRPAQKKLESIEAKAQAILLTLLKAGNRAEIQARLPEKLGASRERLLQALEALGSAAPAVTALLTEQFILSEAACRLSSKLSQSAIEKRFKAEAAMLATKLTVAATALGKAQYPFEHKDKELTLAKFAMPYQVEKRELFEVLGKCNYFQNRLNTVYFCVLGRCAEFAAVVESGFG